MPKESKESIKEWTKAIFIAVAVALIVRTFIIAPIVVDGESMDNTLHDRDRMIVSKLSGIERFDIVVFHANEKQDYIKRVIGLPGDKIEYRHDELYINGEKYEEPYLEEKKKEHYEMYGGGMVFTDNFTLKGTWNYEEVPEGTLFVLGDNRPNSKDSRHIGFIPIDNVVGEAKAIYWPLERFDLSPNKHAE